jgi:hypothetical protein
MFSYCPPKSNSYGQAMRPSNLPKAWQKTQSFLNTYFEPAEPENIRLKPFFNRFWDAENHTRKCMDKAVQVFGNPTRPESLQWELTPGNYQQAISFILEGYPWPKQPSDPIWLSLTFWLVWKASVLPKVDWPDRYLKPSHEKFRRSLFIVYLRNHGFIQTILVIPLSSKDPASYEFLGRFSADAPFKMNPKHFRVTEPAGKNGKLARRKPDAVVAARLHEAINQTRPL